MQIIKGVGDQAAKHPAEASFGTGNWAATTEIGRCSGLRDLSP